MSLLLKPKSLLAISCLVYSTITMAWDVAVTGTISKIDGVGGSGGAPGNFDIRVYIKEKPSFCAGAPDPSWAYINANDPNYKALLAMLLIAQTTSKTVTLYTTKDSGRYCQIGYISLGSQ